MASTDELEGKLSLIAEWLSGARDGRAVEVNEFKVVFSNFLMAALEANPEFDEIDDEDLEELEALLRVQVNDSDDWEVVGRHSMTDASLLTYLFEISQHQEQLSDVAVMVANNPYCDQTLLAELASVNYQWEETSVRIGVACNPSTSEGTLQFLWETIPGFEGTDYAADLVWCLARNPRTPTQVLQAIADSDYVTESSIPVGWQNPNLAPVNYALAANPHTPQVILEQLCQRGSEFVPGEWTVECLSAATQNLDFRRQGKDYVPADSEPPPVGDAGRWRFFWTES